MSLTIRFLFAILCVLTLSILPLPDALCNFRPSWALLFLLSLQFYFPKYFSLLLLLILGLCLDVLLTTITGEHSFALLLTSWIASGKVRRFRFYTKSQQMSLVGIYCLVYESILFLINAFLGYHVQWFNVLLTALSGLLFWPLVMLFTQNVLQKSRKKQRPNYSSFMR